MRVGFSCAILGFKSLGLMLESRFLGSFREVRRAGRNHVYSSGYLCEPVVTSYKKT